jgi:hypothetical protein
MTSGPFWILARRSEQRKIPAMPIEEEIELFRQMRFWRICSFILALTMIVAGLALHFA